MLIVVNPGQSWGGERAGVTVVKASAFNGAANSRGAGLEILNSQGQGVFVANDSFANIAGARIWGTSHGGLVMVNNSTSHLESWDAPLTEVTGAGYPDLFCDSTSLISGVAKATYNTKECERALTEGFVPLP